MRARSQKGHGHSTAPVAIFFSGRKVFLISICLSALCRQKGVNTEVIETLRVLRV